MGNPVTRGGWDVHTHLIPEPVVTAARRGEFGLEIVDEQMVGRAFRVPLQRIIQPAALLNWVDTSRLQGAVFSPPPPLYRPDLSDSNRRRWVALVNEGLHDIAAEHGPALQPMAYVPAEDPTLATAIIEDLPDEFVGVTVGTNLAGRSYSDPEYDHMWAALTDRDLPAFLHPGECADDRLGSFYLANLLGNPYETTLAAAHILLGGTYDRFPTLKLILAHGGGAVAALVGRWERGHDTQRPGIAPLALPLLEVARRLYVDTVVHSPAVLNLLTEVFGEDRILYGSDWPFPMGADTVRPVPGANADLENQILVGNPLMTFGTGRHGLPN
jgi:aminocarboxymuconate-semialdehyde decarboxylase